MPPTLPTSEKPVSRAYGGGGARRDMDNQFGSHLTLCHLVTVSLGLMVCVVATLVYAGSVGLFVTHVDAMQRLEVLEFQNKVLIDQVDKYVNMFAECHEHTDGAKRASKVISEVMKTLGESQAMTTHNFFEQSRHNEGVDKVLTIIHGSILNLDNDNRLIEQRVKRLELITDEMSKPKRPQNHNNNNNKPVGGGVNAIPQTGKS